MRWSYNRYPYLRLEQPLEAKPLEQDHITSQLDLHKRVAQTRIDKNTNQPILICIIEKDSKVPNPRMVVIFERVRHKIKI